MSNERTIAEVDKALAAYYKALDKEEQYAQNTLSYYCDENGVDEEGLKDDMTSDDPADSVLIDIDDDFPIPNNEQIDNDEQRQQYIFSILKQCYNNPDRSWDHLTNGTPSFNTKLFESVQMKDIEQCKKLLKDQCPAIYNQGMNTDVGLLQIISISSKYQFDYLQHLVDMYDRDRIRMILTEKKEKTWPISSWVKKGNNPHLKALAKLQVPRLAKPKKNEEQTVRASEIAQAAIKSFNHRICSKLLFNSMKKINDLIEPTLAYVSAALDFIVNLVETKSKTKKLACPFQFDLCIAIGAPIEVKNNEQENSDGDDDDDDDTPNEAPPSGDYQDYIGDIQKKLTENKLKHKKETLKDQDDAKRAFRESFEEVRKSVEEEEKEKDKYPFRKRFISIIDRRESKKNNDLKDSMFLFEPPNGIHTRNIPKVEASEWYISATRTCLLPNMKYDKNAAVGNANPNHKDEEKKDKKLDEDENIGASSHCKGGLLTFSFHVKAIDQIKCYLFWNGQMIRCLADELIWILPQLFDMEKEENKTYIKTQEFKLLVKNMSEKLKDSKYEAFVKMNM